MIEIRRLVYVEVKNDRKSEKEILWDEKNIWYEDSGVVVAYNYEN